jgi:hypothetical protein
MANKLNMAIAKTHQVSTRLVGMQITSGNFIAIGLSALQMTVGFIFLSNALIAGRWFMYLLVIGIGIALAFLIERLSLGGLMAIRGSNEAIDALEADYYERLRKMRQDRGEMDVRQLEELGKQEEELKEQHLRQLKTYVKRRGISIPVTVIGMGLSATIGDIFWHAIFAPLKNPWAVYPMSLGCAAVIGLTFIYSELYKTIMDSSLADIIRDTSLMKVTVANEREVVQLDTMVQAFDNMRKDDRIIETAQNRVQDALVKDLENFADAVAEGIDVLRLEGPRRRRRKALPAPKAKRTLYRENKEAFAAFMEEHPEASLGDIQEHFQISRSAAGEWRLLYEQDRESANAPVDEGEYVEVESEGAVDQEEEEEMLEDDEAVQEAIEVDVEAVTVEEDDEDDPEDLASGQ